jgi:2-polyprenyl-3-methyl-5-hydroxy-6-metoxy-1,4-benzoquinol methylase
MGHVDEGQAFDFGRTSTDYEAYRPGPPPEFYERLQAFGACLPGQRILDLGTGTGEVARNLSKRGCETVGVDIAAEQIEAAKRMAVRDGLKAEFRVTAVEDIDFAPQSFDAVTANQCWLYFDLKKLLPRIAKILKPGGQLIPSHFSYLALKDSVAHFSDELVLKFNPKWNAAFIDYDNYEKLYWQWSQTYTNWNRRAGFFFDAAIPFTREGWRGRMRTCRGVGAAVDLSIVDSYDRELKVYLDKNVPERFTVLHRCEAHLFTLANS